LGKRGLELLAFDIQGLFLRSERDIGVLEFSYLLKKCFYILLVSSWSHFSNLVLSSACNVELWVVGSKHGLS
jgi:hypothetical protein